MSFTPNLKTTFLYVTSLSLISLFVLALIQGWYASRSVEEYILKEEQLTHEISELELLIHDLQAHIVRKDSELKVRDQLLEEKNIELDHTEQEVIRWKSLYFKEKARNGVEADVVVYKKDQADGSSFSSLSIR